MDAAELAGAIAAEKRLLSPAVRADPGAVSELLDDDFTEIGQTGTLWTRSQIIDVLGAEGSDSGVIDASDWAVREVAAHIALVEFQTRQGGIGVRRTTLWRRRDGVWRAVAHQGTRIVD
jgi:hypothetical protein